MQVLDTPLRLTWELNGRSPALDQKAALTVAREIAEAGVLFVTLDDAPFHHPAIREVLDELTSGGCQVTAVLPDAHGLVPEMPLAGLAIDAAPCLDGSTPDLNGLAACFEQARDMGYDPFLWLTPFKGYLSEIVRLFEFCSELEVGRFKLSNLPISASFSAIDAGDIPRPDDLRDIAVSLRVATQKIHGKVALEIHDRFLWEVLADQSVNLSEYGGCQAANSLAHVDSRGNVYPCSSWPERLGNLKETSLDMIWASTQRFTILKKIAEVPAGCNDCSDYSECFAGCRGLSASYDFMNEGRDPMCAGRR
jgi:radical SAM protein with 4Fe4S-binding SPASM domain